MIFHLGCEQTEIYSVREQYDMKDKEFLPGYDTNENGAGNINFMKCALLPSWRETFKKKLKHLASR